MKHGLRQLAIVLFCLPILLPEVARWAYDVFLTHQ
jgi:hypothetical protein